MTTPVYRTKKEVVIEVIREAILSGELEPGDRLLQLELAERFNVSPTPVREALQQLEAEGVLVRSPHKGVRVADVKLEDAREIYLIRSVLEALATRLAVPHLEAGDVEQLQALQADIVNQIEQGQLMELRRLNQEFHMLIYQSAHLPKLFQLIRNLWTQFPWDTLYVLPGRAKASAVEHQKLIDAIAAGDADLAAQRMQAHIDHGATALADYLTSTQHTDHQDDDSPET